MHTGVNAQKSMHTEYLDHCPYNLLSQITSEIN